MFIRQCMIPKLPVSEYSGLSKDFTTFLDILLQASAIMNTSISTLNTTTISTIMTIATIAPSSSPEPTGGEVVSGGGRNGVG